MSFNPCAEFLKSGIYETYDFTNTGDFQYDFKHYITTEEFKNDFRSNKFSFGLEAFDPTTGITDKLNFGASDDEINEFKRKIENNTNLTIKQSFFSSYASSKPNELATKKYFECVEKMFKQKGFSTDVTQTGNIVKFTVFFNKIAAANPNPKVEQINVENATISSQSFKIGDDLDISNEIVINFIDSTKPALISIDTDQGPISEIIELKKQKSNDGNPIGTIIASYLNWEEFQYATDNNKQTENEKWDREYSFWSPCDGRDTQGSDFSKIAKKSNAPDLRGVFLRGLNTFDRYETDNGIAIVSDLRKDPETTRTRGSFQNDDFKSHSHTYNGRTNAAYMSGAGTSHSQNGTSDPTSVVGGAETRPKNIAIYYYIKIN